MSLLKTNPVTALKKRSAASMSIFTKTLHDLMSINDDAAKAKELKEAEKAQIVSDIEQIDQTMVENHKVIQKIEDFLA